MKTVLILIFSISFFASYSQEKVLTIIDEAPIYPGCEKSNTEDLKKCMTIKMSSYVSKNFNTDLLNTLDLPIGQTRIDLTFDINKKGKITKIKAKSIRKELEKEAIRIIKSLPHMIKPGVNKGKPVSVSYALPIVFTITD